MGEQENAVTVLRGMVQRNTLILLGLGPAEGAQGGREGSRWRKKGGLSNLLPNTLPGAAGCLPQGHPHRVSDTREWLSETHGACWGPEQEPLSSSKKESFKNRAVKWEWECEGMLTETQQQWEKRGPTNRAEVVGAAVLSAPGTKTDGVFSPQTCWWMPAQRNESGSQF